MLHFSVAELAQSFIRFAAPESLGDFRYRPDPNSYFGQSTTLLHLPRFSQRCAVRAAGAKSSLLVIR